MIGAASEAIDYARSRTRTDIEADRPIQHLLIRNLEVFGEAAYRLTPQIRANHPEIPWTKIRGMRNRLVHSYFDIDLDIVWNTVTQALPEILPWLESLLGNEAK